MDWVLLYYVGTVVLNMSESVFWKSTLRKLHAVFKCHCEHMTPVPIEEVDMDLPSKYPTVEALLARADGDYPNGGKKEGIVVRPTTPVFCPLISASLSMKIVSNKYLLKNEG